MRVRATEQQLLFRLDDARRAVEIERGRRDRSSSDVLRAAGKAEGIAEVLELLGVAVPVWINSPFAD